MAKVALKKGETDVITFVFLMNTGSTTGAGVTNVTSGAVSAYYARPGSAASSFALASITATSAHVDGGFCAVDTSGMPGLYRVDLPDAVCAAGADNAVVMIHGTSLAAPVLMEIQLTDVDLNDASPNVTVADIANDAITAAAIATDAIDADALKTDAITEIQTGLATPTNITSASGVTLADNAITSAKIATDAIVAAGIKADAVTKIQTGLATPTNITSASGVTLAATQTGVTIPTVTSITNGVTLADDAITSAKFDESTAFPVKSADTGSTQIARVGADSDTLETLSDQIDTIDASGTAAAVWGEALSTYTTAGTAGKLLTTAAAASGSGATEKTYTVTDASSGLPIADVNVWVTTDAAGSNIVASGDTNASGQVTFYLDSGTTYYIWRQKAGYNFTNPDQKVC